jgi:peptide/nickel transport system substrate-binding protein
MKERSSVLRRPVPALVMMLVLSSGLLATAGVQTSGATLPKAGSSASTTLTGALQDTLNPDPDVFFDLQGVMVTNSVYESLVVNPPGSVETEGLLAESWDISPDGLTYTFKLKPGIKFADGTPITSEVMQKSFERRTAVAGSPSYMLAEVAGYETPDPSTFVIHLKTPVNNFLARMSSPWAPMATNPKIIDQQEQSGDKLGVAYLKTHGVGSGPYVISEFVPDQEIVLKRNENYWGTKPFFKEIHLKIISDPVSQRIQLEAGDLDFIEGVNPQAADALSKKKSLNVAQPPAFNMTILQVNSKRAPFTPEVSAALVKAIPYSKIVHEIFGKWATPAHQTITANRVPSQYSTWAPKYDPAVLKQAFEALPKAQQAKAVTIGYPAYDNGVHRQLSDDLAAILQKAGFKVQLSEFTIGKYFEFVGQPKNAPTIVVSTQPDDGVHPDNWYRIWMHTQGALNVGAAGTAEADALFDQANATPPAEGIPYDLYSQGGKIVTDAGMFIPVANAPIIWVTQADLENVTVRDASDQALVLQLLKRKGKQRHASG